MHESLHKNCRLLKRRYGKIKCLGRVKLFPFNPVAADLPTRYPPMATRLRHWFFVSSIPGLSTTTRLHAPAAATQARFLRPARLSTPEPGPARCKTRWTCSAQTLLRQPACATRSPQTRNSYMLVADCSKGRSNRTGHFFLTRFFVDSKFISCISNL